MDDGSKAPFIAFMWQLAQNAEYANRSCGLVAFPRFLSGFHRYPRVSDLTDKYFDMFDMQAVIKHCLKTFQNCKDYGEMFSQNSRLPYVSMRGYIITVWWVCFGCGQFALLFFD